MTSSDTSQGILFADVCGSTRLYESLGDTQAFGRITSCLSKLRTVVESNEGVIVKTVGDELLCRFPSANSALSAAIAMQDALQHHRPGHDGVTIKIGFTFGPVIEDQGDVFWDTVNLGARIVALANPGQILTTQPTVKALSPAGRAACRELYSANVKGKAERIPVYEVLWKQDENLTILSGHRSTLMTRKHSALKLTYRGTTWVVNGQHKELTIGRDSSCDISVPSDTASRQHALVFVRQGKHILADRSSNGTYIRNGDQEVVVRREEVTLIGNGQIGLGQSVTQSGVDVIDFERVQC